MPRFSVRYRIAAVAACCCLGVPTGAGDERLAAARSLQRKAARILAEAIDCARQGQLALRAPK